MRARPTAPKPAEPWVPPPGCKDSEGKPCVPEIEPSWTPEDTIQDYIITAMDKDRALPKAVRTFFGTHLVGQQVPKARPLCVQKVLEHVAKA